MMKKMNQFIVMYPISIIKLLYIGKSSYMQRDMEKYTITPEILPILSTEKGRKLEDWCEKKTRGRVTNSYHDR